MFESRVSGRVLKTRTNFQPSKTNRTAAGKTEPDTETWGWVSVRAGCAVGTTFLEAYLGLHYPNLEPQAKPNPPKEEEVRLRMCKTHQTLKATA